jgi:HSP20 family protein
MLARINRGYVPTYRDDFFNDRFFNSFNTASGKGITPAVNVVEDEKEFRIEVAVPGLSKEDFNIEVEEDVLTISSVKKESNEKTDEKRPQYTRREFNYSAFKRSFQLPETIDQEQIKASHDAGIVSVQLPKKEEVVQPAPKQIEVK